MNERENIFKRIREALKAPAHGPPGGLPTVAEHRGVMPAVSSECEAQMAMFHANSAELRANIVLVSDMRDLETKMAALRDAEGWKKVAAHVGELAITTAESLDLPVLRTNPGFDKEELAACDAGITECDALVAQTGSVLLTSRSAGGRALSCLPPHHVIIARREQLVADLPAAFEGLVQKYGANYPSMISFISGPSRTGDIERILVLGAHGPKYLTIFVV